MHYANMVPGQFRSTSICVLTTAIIPMAKTHILFAVACLSDLRVDAKTYGTTGNMQGHNKPRRTDKRQIVNKQNVELFLKIQLLQQQFDSSAAFNLL